MKDKVAIVTGAGQGIGFEICRQLIAQGARVVLNDSDPSLAKDSAKQLGPHCIPVPGDVADVDLVRHIVHKTISTFGRIDIAIANAGITLFGDFLSYPPESLHRVMQVNLAGSFFLAQTTALQMKAQGDGGSILFMSSVTGHQAHKNLAAYGMTKAALEMLARNLVIELSPYKITVNAVAPGATMTERTAGDMNYEKTWSAITPMGRPATARDIADAALFLVSPQARHITGQTIIVDGGWTAVSPEPY
ncbi:MAG TPA: SDR family oxidoreductase [Puia sp.]|nr:SDR family oxidoreductase [Puia sp.]